MTQKMKIFKTIKKHYAVLGIISSNHSLSERICFGFLLSGCNIISQFVYASHVANGFTEYIECICSAFGAVIVFVCFAAVFAKRTSLFETIENIEKLLNGSEAIIINING